MELSDSGILRATTTTRANHFFLGFTGGVSIILTDEKNNALWQSHWNNFGVNLHTTRVEDWTEQVPQKLLPQVKNFIIVHKHVKNDRTKDYIAGVDLAMLLLLK
uniref:Uncharacterized protein n=1 Tax=Panagrolaimus davidi TaxID=227884 RepID=A0A914P324_9BILA